MEYTFYQLRTLDGDADEFQYLIEHESPYLDSIFDHIEENEIDMKKHILVKITWK